jgi:hypothetical protein
MKMSIAGALAAMFVACAIGVAAPAQADGFQQPWDFYGDEIINLPFFGSIRFVDGPDVEPGFPGVKAPRGPRGADLTGPGGAGNPSG